MLSSRTARWSAGTSLLCVAVLAVSWLFLVSPRRTEAAELRDANVATQTQNDLLEVKIAQLRAQFARLPESQAELADILTQMPADAGVPRLVRDLDAMAKSTGVTLTTVTPGAAQPLTMVEAATPAGTAASPATAATGAAGSAGAGTGVGGSPAAGSGSAAQAGTVVAIPVTVVLSGDYFETVAFLKQLQTQMPRAFLVSTVQMAAGSSTGSAEATAGAAAGAGSATSGEVQVTLAGSVFALPGMTADALAAGTGAHADGTAKSPMTGQTPTLPGQTLPAQIATAPATAGSTATQPSPTATREDS
jgi:Tfp pilus assembly protein PilO